MQRGWADVYSLQFVLIVVHLWRSWLEGRLPKPGIFDANKKQDRSMDKRVNRRYRVLVLSGR